MDTIDDAEPGSPVDASEGPDGSDRPEEPGGPDRPDASTGPAPPDAFDNPWKEAIAQAFPEFLAFYFPASYRQELCMPLDDQAAARRC